MAYSMFYSLFNEKVKNSGYESVFSLPEFKKLVFKTVIIRRSKNRDRLFTYYDDHDNILFECTENAVKKENKNILLPELGKVEEVDKRADYLKTYHQQKIRQFHLSLGIETDCDIISVLEKEKNKQKYIKDLIREDIKRKEKEKIKK